MIHVPKAFVDSTVAREGVAGESWITSLPALVEEHCAAWRLEPAGSVRYGYVGVVFPVTREGIKLALKVSWVDRSSEQEALALRAWDGCGAVRLLESRDTVGVMLLEWLNPDRTLTALPPDEASEIAAVLLRRLAIPAPGALRPMREEIDDLVRTLEPRWQEVGKPFPLRLLKYAIELCKRTSDGNDRLMVNCDLHYDNVLEGVREPWSVIDPKALAGDVEFGVAQLLWNRFDEMENRAALERRLRIIAEAADLDLRTAREWSVVRVVDYWLWAIGEDFTEDPVRCRTLIDWLAPRFTG